MGKEQEEGLGAGTATVEDALQELTGSKDGFDEPTEDEDGRDDAEATDDDGTQDDKDDSAPDKDEDTAGSELKLTPRQERAAKQYGIDLAKIKALGQAGLDALDDMAIAFDKKMGEFGKAKQLLDKGRKAGDSKDDDAGKDKDEAEDKGKKDGHGDDELPELELLPEDEDNFYGNQDDVKKHNLVRAHLLVANRRLAQLEEFVQGIVQEKEEVSIREFFKDLLDEKGKASRFPKFGSDPFTFARLDDGTPESKAMAELIEKAKAIRLGYQMQLGQRIPLLQALESALAMEDPDAIRADERRNIRKRHQSRTNARSFKPTSRQASPADDAGARLQERAEKELGIVIPD